MSRCVVLLVLLGWGCAPPLSDAEQLVARRALVAVTALATETDLTQTAAERISWGGPGWSANLVEAAHEAALSLSLDCNSETGVNQTAVHAHYIGCPGRTGLLRDGDVDVALGRTADGVLFDWSGAGLSVGGTTIQLATHTELRGILPITFTTASHAGNGATGDVALSGSYTFDQASSPTDGTIVQILDGEVMLDADPLRLQALALGTHCDLSGEVTVGGARQWTKLHFGGDSVVVSTSSGTRGSLPAPCVPRS